MRKSITIVLMVCLGSMYSFSQIPQLVTQTICFNSEAQLPLSQFIKVEGNPSEILEGLQVTITSNYEPGIDKFTFSSLLNANISFDSTNGTLTVSGSNSISTYNQILSNIYFETKENQNEVKTFLVTLSALDFLTSTGHFYQFFPSTGISWEDAKAEAESNELFGMQGYLTTITTADENNFILERVSGTAWIGASDETDEGIWRWVTGPEGLANNGAGRLLSRSFTNWETGEPNNAGPEHYAHMMDWSTPPGKWNDLALEGGSGQYAATGYIVEYGGMPGDPNIIDNIRSFTSITPAIDTTISGPRSVCPNAEQTVYSRPEIENHLYFWEVIGGTIQGSEFEHEITVNWGDTNPNATIYAYVQANGCNIRDTIPIRVNEQLEPPISQGGAFVCFTDLNTPQSYSTPLTAGSTYTWKPTNGVVVDGQGTNEVSILWDGTADGELYFTESTSTTTDICDGDSPLKLIDIRAEILYDLAITHVSCYNGSDGRATLDVTTSGTEIIIDWKTRGLGAENGNEISQLPAGSYSVDITLDGCLINVPVTITEPEELVGTTETSNVLCYGESNGIATALVQGGTGAYRYRWSHDNNQSGPTVDNLPAGSHSVNILDENDCLLTLEFIITEPDSLEIPEITPGLVSCPGGSDGTLEAIVSGGTAPYNYDWVGLNQITKVATGLAKGEYQVIVTDANGCTQSLSQTVSEAIPKVLLPNAFTPNGDGLNETFGPTTPCDIEFKMEIYNRWGKTIFTTNSSTNQWDGTYNGLAVPEGNYGYVASWSFEANDRIITGSRKGEVNLFR